MPISLRQFRYFLAIAETGQASHAAVSLNVSQSTVTTAIQQLEASLGATLFRRTRTGMELTVEGSRFLPHARNVVAAVGAARRAQLTENTSLRGVIRVGVTYTVAGYVLARHYSRFARNYPDIEVQLFELPRAAIEIGLKDRTLDLAVMLVSNLQDRDAIASETLFRSRRRLWLPVEHPLLQVESVDIKDIADAPYIMLSVDEAHQTASRYWSPTGFRPNVIFTTSSVEAVRSMVADGLGLTILSDMVYRPWSLEGLRIEKRNLVSAIPSMDVGLAWLKASKLGAAARAFADFLGQSVSGGV